MRFQKPKRVRTLVLSYMRIQGFLRPSRSSKIAFGKKQAYIFYFVSLEPSGPPLNVQALTNSSTSILVKWDPPNELDRNGVITHYMVNYSSLSGEASINTTDNSTEILVTHLRKYTSYYFTVRAVNKIGVGPPSGGDVKNTTFEDGKFATKCPDYRYSRVSACFVTDPLIRSSIL